ncbi:hypothetical protein LCGC14_3043620 [marine sediment metagenome]|uniref:Uncharacterized protein n=1 Tax=marine sediment metagenome TaxID=412755 RepID=A0A0F8WPD5_9ZZZZ
MTYVHGSRPTKKSEAACVFFAGRDSSIFNILPTGQIEILEVSKQEFRCKDSTWIGDLAVTLRAIPQGYGVPHDFGAPNSSVTRHSRVRSLRNNLKDTYGIKPTIKEMTDRRYLISVKEFIQRRKREA